MTRKLKTLGLLAIAALALAAITAAPAGAAFGLKNLSADFKGPDGSPSMQAGSHPFAFTNTIEVNTKESDLGFELPEGVIKDLFISAPPGLVGNPTAVPRCSSAGFMTIKPTGGGGVCPDSSSLGIVTTTVAEPEENSSSTFTSPVFNLHPPPGYAATIGFWTLVVPFKINLKVNPDPPYNVIATPSNIPQVVPFYRSRLTLWGNPASPAHDGDRGACADAGAALCPVSIPEKPFLTMPTRCTGPLETGIAALSWEGEFFSETVLSSDGGTPPTPIGTTGCSKLKFSPEASAAPTTQLAESSSGLNFTLAFKDEGLTSPDGIAQSQIKKAVVRLPKGVTLNPSVAGGLATCSVAELGRESATSLPGEGCPQASKVGEVEVETPLLEGKLIKGALYVATQDQNTLATRFAIYMVIKDPELGISVKLAGKVEPDEQSGQVITTFDEVPQFPFSQFRFRFREGARSPLVTPPACGKYTTEAEFFPWSGGPPKLLTSDFEVTKGVGGGPCPPAGVPPFSPGFQAGSENNAAGRYSPFYMRLTRQDGEQDMTRFDSILPPGVTGKIAGIPRCPDAALAAAELREGRAELASPSCPAASQLGHVLAGAGVGEALTYVEGKVYLAGPYGGRPLSIAVITPAVAGPFDVGTVLTRVALDLDPNTGEVIVDGAASDPIPHILEGIPLKLRDLRVYVDRPEFTLNPTSCEPSSTRATIFGGFADPFSAADDVPVTLSSRYQAASCASLAFKPKLTISLKGGTKRGANTALRAVLNARRGDANVKGATVTLPVSQFIDNAHINDPCTRDQFARNACPPKSILGSARAFTPLLDAPLEGKVYFRSNGGVRDLPDVVAALKGQFDFNLVIAILTSKTGRITTRVLNAPDAPVSKVILSMAGGKKGLLENSENLCRKTQRAKFNLVGQNGRAYVTKPAIKTSCGSKGKGKGKRRG